MDDQYFEAVEVCPYCDGENIYPFWDVNTNGYIAVCKHCGRKILLCDECMHNEDNSRMNCDWCRTYNEVSGECFRGVIRNFM